jgi:Zn-dependent protease
MFSSLMLLLKFAKFGPILKAAALMLLSVGAYALLFGWQFAVGFVLLIFIHEMGHYEAARRMGLNVGLPTFIPFVGAWISLKDQPLSVEHEASIAFAGPLWGTIAATAMFFAALDQHSQLLLALAYSGFIINLFNLVPVSPFDGGRIVAILSPKVWFIGAPALIVVYFYVRTPMLLIILLLLAPTIWAALRSAWHGETPTGNPRYYEVPLAARVRYGSYYVMLLLFLCVMSFRSYQQLQVVRGQ